MSGQESNMSLEAYGGEESEFSSGRKGSSYVPGERSGKWSEEEHMKYIAFIDFNKDRMRSKDKRRSNKFYQEMADFIVTRNALQCRSHHQKLEEKYTHAPRIVNLFKPTIDKTAYRQAVESLHLMQRQSHSQRTCKSWATEIGSRSVETQTDICGIQLEFINISPNCYIIQSAPYRPPRQPSFYYNHFYMAQSIPPTTHSLPAADGLVSPVTWEGSVFPQDLGGSSM